MNPVSKMQSITVYYDDCRIKSIWLFMISNPISLGKKHYCQTSNIRHIKSRNLNISRLVLQLSLLNPVKPHKICENAYIIRNTSFTHVTTNSYITVSIHIAKPFMHISYIYIYMCVYIYIYEPIHTFSCIYPHTHTRMYVYHIAISLYT